MDVLEVQERYSIGTSSSEVDAESLVLKSMIELDESDGDEQEAAIAKTNAMAEAYGKITEGHRHEHEMTKIAVNSALATVAGVVVAVISDTRIFPKAAEAAMRWARGRI